MRQQSGEYFALNSMFSTFGMDFALNFGRENHKNKKRSSSQNHRLLDHVHSICLAFSWKKAFVVTCFWAKVGDSLVLVQKFTLAWRAQAVIWGAKARNPPSPVHRRSQDF